MNPLIVRGPMTHERPLDGKSIASPASWITAVELLLQVSQRIKTPGASCLNLLRLMFGVTQRRRGDQYLPEVQACLWEMSVIRNDEKEPTTGELRSIFYRAKCLLDEEPLHPGKYG